MLKNLKEKLKKGITKKKITTIAIFAVAVIIAIIAIVVNQTSEQSSKRKKIIADAELARAMTYDQFADGDDAIEGTDNVKFSAFFLRDINGDGYAEKIKGTCKQIGKEDTLYMEVNVQTDGILKNAKIEIDGKNFYLATTAPKDNELKDNYIGTNIKTLEFNDMANGTQKLLSGIVRSGDYAYSSSKTSAIGSNINNLSRNDNKIIFTGTYVGSDGNEIQINKEINLQTDWYGTTSASITTASSTYYDIQDRQNEEDGTLTLEAGIRAYEDNNQLNIEKNYVEGTIPQLNGFDPISVTMESSTDSFSYDETNRKFIATREAINDANGNITKSVSRYNYYTLKIVYPLEAYKSLDASTVTISIPVMTYYEGYNNQNEEFTNPYKSNEAKSTLLYTYRDVIPQDKPAGINVKVGDYVTSPTYRYLVSKKKPLKIYNGISSEENDDIYDVEWYVTKGTKSTSDGLIMRERKDGEDIVSDSFIKSDATTESMENLTVNVGIGFSNANNFLAEDGFIKVYDDETDELLVTFTKADWGKYTKISPYKFNMPVKHIRVETSETEDGQYLYVYSQKKLDDEYITTNYTREQFDDLKYIRSQMSAYIGDTFLGTVTHTANYEAPFSIASLSVRKNTLSTQLTEKNEILTIKATADSSANQVGWTNGSFLIKLPTDIITADINNVEINNSNVSLTSYEYIENDNGRFIKVNTQNISSMAQTFEIKLDTNITPDPRIATTSENFELWASNEEGADYYYGSADIYDVNDNLNTVELVHKSTATISLIAPNSLLTNQTASDFDKDGTQVVSPQIADVKPQLATVSQDTPEKTVRIGAQIKNNYSSAITDVMMLGKIPFEGNTYVISGADLGSEFTTKMTNAGIEVPEALQGKVTVYYSENETPDKDLTKESNGWKTADNITNWDNVKTFLIDFKDIEIASGAEYTFYYTIKVPNGLDYNKKSFSHHGIYFALKTTEGKYKTQTEPNKLGLRIAEKYNLELQKYQTGKTNLVPGATYKITKEATDTEDEESKTAVTNAEGKLELQNLYAKRTYSIEEIKVPEDFELNTDVIKIIGTIQEDGSLQVEKTEGTTREDIEITKAGEDEPYKVTIKVEDEAKAKLKITKTEKDTTTPLRGVRYKLTGEGLPESGKNIATNIDGEIIVKGLKIGEEYTLEETKAEGYYLASPIKFTVTNTDGTYEINVLEGTVKESTVTEEENLPTANIQIENEKIPTYNLEISKIKRVTSVEEGESGGQKEDTVYLAGAKFRLYKDSKLIGTYSTNESGKLAISDLYQYIDGKNENATYVLKEVWAPDGYAKVKDITFKVEKTNGELKLVNVDGDDEKYTVDGNIVKLTIEDSPSFRLIKKDAETSERITGVKFAIYNIDDGSVPAKNSNGEYLGTKESIDGKEYYTVTTNANGEVNADLPEGMYKAVEVWAPDKYDISDSVYYFGVGESREGKETFTSEWAKSINANFYEGVETSDGGYVTVGSFTGWSLDLGNGIVLKNSSVNSRVYEGLIVKYNSNMEVEWAHTVAGYYQDEIVSIEETLDGGFIVGGNFESKTITLENGIVINKKDEDKNRTDGFVIKYTSDGSVEWAHGIGAELDEEVTAVTVMSDGGYVVGGLFQSLEVDLGNGKSLKYSSDTVNNYLEQPNGFVIKYSSTGEVEWAKSIGEGDEPHYAVVSVESSSDGGCIIGGCFPDNKEIMKLNENGDEEWSGSYYNNVRWYDSSVSILVTSDENYIVGIQNTITKIHSNGDVEWSYSISDEGAKVREIIETNEGYVFGGEFDDETIDIGNGIILCKHLGSSTDMMLVQLGFDGKPEFARGIGGEYITIGLRDIIKTTDENFTILSYFYGSKLDLEDGNVLSGMTTNGDRITIMIKYQKSELPNPTITDAIGVGGSGSDSDSASSVIECSDGGYLVGGNFFSKSIELGNGEVLYNNDTQSAMLIKYNKDFEVMWAKKIAGNYWTSVSTIAECNDDGFIVAGRYTARDSNGVAIDFGNGVNIKGDSASFMVKYDENGEAKWAKKIDVDNITKVQYCSDGGYIIGGSFQNNVNLGNNVYLNGKGSFDGYIIKYNEFAEVEWAHIVGGTDYESVSTIEKCSDDGYIVAGDFESKNIELEEGVVLENKGGGYDSYIIKYAKDGSIEWTKTIGGAQTENIESACECEDGGYIIAGSFYSDTIDLGNDVILKNPGSFTGFVIKYDMSNEVEWAKVIGGENSDAIFSIMQCSDGGYVVGGNFSSSKLRLGNGIVLVNRGSSDGMIIKYNMAGNVEWAKNVGEARSQTITSVCECKDGSYIANGRFNSDSLKFENGLEVINKGDFDGLILRISDQIGVQEVQELEVENNRKVFKITTDIQEIDNVKGGTISGEDEDKYEEVKYGDSSKKEIKMVPNNGYEITGVTVNGEDYSYSAQDDGSFVMPVFDNMIEDKHVVVKYSLKDNKIVINKVDNETKEKLAGATFKLDQIDERNNPDSKEIIGELTDNGQEYVEVNYDNEITGVMGELTKNGEYYFVKNDDGTYTPTNSKTYQTVSGGTAGIQNSTANSYIPIDLTSVTGQYAIVINTRCSSESEDNGYATITESTTAPLYYDSTGRFMYVSGTSDASDYISAILEGGKTYYLHLGYRKDSSVDTNEDQVVINSIKMYSAIGKVYNFTTVNNKIESTNQGQTGTDCNSYIPIDLTNYTGKYNLIVNAEMSGSENADHGYAEITYSDNRVNYGGFINLYGTCESKNYIEELQGGRICYLHLGYYKGSENSDGDDKLIINSIKIELNDSELYHTTVETNSEGQAITQIPFGKYSITETKAPNGYWLNETPTIVEFRSTEGSVHEFTIEDEAKAKLTVHHYIKGTTTKLADDEYSEAHVGDSYTTSPKLDLDKYELEVDENGKLVLPENATGTYSQTPTEVTYYYVEKKIPLTVHHYIEGTATQVLLKDGTPAEDQVDSGLEGDTYTTSAISDENLSDEYELVAMPDNANGTYVGDEVIVTYYYKKVSRTVNLVKYQQDGKTALQGAKFNIRGRQEDIIVDEIKNNGTYYFENSNGKYISNNQNKASTVANSYMKIDMTKASEDAKVIVNAEVSSEYNYDIGYATITQTETAPAYNVSTGRFVYISGTQSAKDYSTTLEKGKVYYLHLGYRKDGSGNSGADIFTVNSIKINDVDYLGYSKIYTTNEQGKIQVKLEAGTYEITETEAPEGYKLPENPTTEITITKETTSEDINITNDKKTGTVTVHHYIEGTTDKVLLTDGSVAEDEIKTGTIGDIYATQARADISEGYELIEEPENASGTYIDGDIEVIYYYRVLPASVLVRHYLEGTTTKLADDETIDGKVGDKYTTSVADVDEMYELVAEPDNKEGKMTKEQIVVTYYYQLKKYPYIVNYLEKDTDKVLHAVKKGDELVYGSAVNSIDEKIDIDGYVFDSFDKDVLTIGTENNEINIYYIKRNDLSYTVNYLEKDTNKVLHEQKVQTGMTFEDEITAQDEVIPIAGYDYDSADKDTLTIKTDENVINLYYTKKDAQVIVHYYEENTTTKLSEDVTINGKVNDTYTTVSADDVPIKYELVAVPDNASGTMTEDTIEVIYYYRVKDAVVNVRYLEKGTDIELADADRIDGKVEDLYQTSAKNIDGYQLVEHTGNEKGKFEVEPLTITYYYLYKTKATVQYIDKITGQILEQSTTEGLEGDDFITESKDFENYVLVEEPAEKTVKMTKEEQTLKYYYIHISGGVIEKHIDVISGQILANAVHNGNEGDVYDIPSRTFDGYDLVEDRLPSNAKGTMKVEPVEVIYYYIYRSKVTAEYIDKETGDKLVDDEVQNGHEGDNYTTERKLFDGYKLIEVPANADGTMTKEDIIVKYYYVRTSGGVIVNHLDIKTNKQLLDETKEEGYEGDPYETHEENISGYDLVKDKYPENATGTMTTETIRVTYYYIKKTEVNVKYVDKETGEEIYEPTNIPGHEGDDYKTEPKDVPGYDLVEEPANKSGTMIADPTEVIYYYKRPAKVIVNYYDIDTKEKLADEVEITGHQGDSYTTEEKDIKYYRVETLPVNKDGKMIVTVTKDENGKDIVEDTTYVNYYYRKLIFNLKVDKTIASVIVNGQETTINGNLGKVEIHRKDISTANVKVVYKIKVTNDSELTGKANVLENIPSGMTMIADNNPGWTINETTASIETDEIKPGESREYQVVLGWQNGDGNIGTKENVASIVTENEAGFNEKDTADNESRANLIVAVGTGEVPYVAIAGGVLMIMIAMTAGVYVIKKRR